MASTTLPVVIQASAAKTATGQTGGFSSELVNRDGDHLNVINIDINVTAVTGTSPTCTFSVQWSSDGGSTWATADPTDAFTAITAAAHVVKQFAVKAPMFRVAYTIGGTSPSFTFTITGTGA